MLATAVNSTGAGPSVWTAVMLITGSAAVGVLVYLLMRRPVDSRAVELRGLVGMQEAAIAQLAETVARMEATIVRLQEQTAMIEREVGPGVGPESGPQEGRANERESMRERVAAMWAEGASAGQIAEAVGAPVGEVELIIALKQVRGG